MAKLKEFFGRDAEKGFRLFGVVCTRKMVDCVCDARSKTTFKPKRCDLACIYGKKKHNRYPARVPTDLRKIVETHIFSFVEILKIS